MAKFVFANITYAMHFMGSELSLFYMSKHVRNSGLTAKFAAFYNSCHILLQRGWFSLF